LALYFYKNKKAKNVRVTLMALILGVGTIVKKIEDINFFPADKPKVGSPLYCLYFIFGRIPVYCLFSSSCWLHSAVARGGCMMEEFFKKHFLNF